MPLKLRDLEHRAPEHGRLRYGIRTERAMKALTTWRMTSPDLEAIEQLAAMYGGTPRPWSDPMASPENQYEVVTTSERISVWLPPNAYEVQNELWTKAGCERRCDGETCTTGKLETACLCVVEKDDKCKPYSRLNVVLPGVNFGGYWRLEVKGKNFAYEAPGMIAAIHQMQGQQGTQVVDLMLTRRQKKIGGQTKKYIVPQFIFNFTPQQMLEGASLVSRMELPEPRASQLELSVASESVWQPVLDDDEIAEAEIVEDDEPQETAWDVPPPDVAVRRNPDPNGPKWIKA